MMHAGQGRDARKESSKAADKRVEKAHRLGGRHRLVIYVARDKDGLGPFRRGRREYLLKYMLLILKHGKFVDAFAKMQV
mgnify:CR=1 FL=1